MRDFKDAIDRSDDPNELRQILSELHDMIEALADSPYDEDAFSERIHDLALVLRYGEHRLEKLLM